jgi:hypothetical protein
MAKKVEDKSPEEMTPEEKLKQLKTVRRFSLFIGINFINFGILALIAAIIMNTSGNEDFQIFSLVVVVIGGLLWHSAYLSISSYREMKNFTSVDEYILHVKQKRELEDRSKG